MDVRTGGERKTYGMYGIACTLFHDIYFKFYFTLWMLILATRISVEGLLSPVISTFCLDKLEKPMG